MTSFPKNELIRLVENNGSLVIDVTGRMNGRGNYLCKSTDCYDMAIKKKRINGTIDREEFEKLLSSLEVIE